MTPVICPAFSAAGAGDIVVRDSLYGFLFITQVALMQRAFHHADFLAFRSAKVWATSLLTITTPESAAIGSAEGDLLLTHRDHFHAGNHRVKFLKA